jgi:hypothetical protein
MLVQEHGLALDLADLRLALVGIVELGDVVALMPC